MKIARAAFTAALIASPAAAQDANYPNVIPSDFARGRTAVLECDNQADGYQASAFAIEGSQEVAVYITSGSYFEAESAPNRKVAQDMVLYGCAFGPKMPS